MMKERIVVGTILLIAVLFLPYWVYGPLLFLGILLLPFYVEAILFGFLIDMLYGSGGHVWLSPAAILAAVLVVAVIPVRERLRFRL